MNDHTPEKHSGMTLASHVTGRAIEAAIRAIPGPTPDDLDRAALARPKIAALVTWLTGKTRDIETHDTMYDDARADIYVGEILEILAALPKGDSHE